GSRIYIADLVQFKVAARLAVLAKVTRRKRTFVGNANRLDRTMTALGSERICGDVAGLLPTLSLKR
ncbi:MAG: hypothetical protein ABJQ14_14140, partial [Hyphomicrobiales bacterium]